MALDESMFMHGRSAELITRSDHGTRSRPFSRDDMPFFREGGNATAMARLAGKIIRQTHAGVVEIDVRKAWTFDEPGA